MEPMNTDLCFEDEYIKENLYSGKRIPIFLKNHIRDCDRCQEKTKALHFVNSIPKSSFGKDFTKVIASWKSGLSDDSENNREIFPNSNLVYDTILFQFVYKHRLRIYIIGYLSVIVAFSYYWFLL
ncbi:hypothetical protein [Leptospira alexanderi]|uniref:hypothetical protein n=1 Tax=Leptospira alexanderi TaxID=100053 RepID=UPI000990D901